jgi:conjugative relaxase-like TrwC/TraI family protein
MSIHKLTAGDGYTYLTRQVAAFDATERGHLGLADYYTAIGEAPGTWLGAGLTGLGAFRPGEVVTEPQMRALFGEGRHPDADAIELAVIEAGGTVDQALAASRLGRPFAVRDDINAFRQETARRFSAHNTAHGQPSTAPLADEIRATIRTQVAQEMFTAEYGRAPVDARELSGFVARASRQTTTAVAGYDLTFSPVKSVSALWALAPRHLAERIEAGHRAAVTDTLSWLERQAAYTRTGRNGIRQIDVTGLIAAAFTHRDSRAGDPDLHTHLVISNKVQALDGRWLALDGRVLFKATVAASERYNTRLEAELTARLGVQFAPRPDPGRDKRPVREIVGVDPRLTTAWSARRASIEDRRSDLAARFQADHGRVPSPVEAIRLAQQATLETRQAKHEPRSLADQRHTWRHQAVQILGGTRPLNRMINTAVGRGLHPGPAITPDWIAHAARHTIQIVQASRATWQSWHVRAEAERHARTAGVPLPQLDQTVTDILEQALAVESLPLSRTEAVTEPQALRRRDGTSAYTIAGADLFTSPTILNAEQHLITAATRHDGRRVPHTLVDQALTANHHVRLNPGQAHLVRALATSGARLQLAIAPAGSGKTTALQVLTHAWTRSGGTVIGLAPSAAAAAVLRQQTGARTDTLAKLVHALTTSRPSGWVRRIGPDTLLVIDEAGMAGTLDLAAAVDYTLARGGSVRLVGDDHQLSAVPAGGVLRDIAHAAGAVTLTELMRFSDPTEAAATLALRAGDPFAIGFYLDRARVHVGDLATTADQAYRDWAIDRAAGLDSVMLAPTRALSAALNARARTDRLTGTTTAGRDVPLADGNRASVGDTIITRANRRDLTTNTGDWVRNGDRWTVTRAHRDGSLTATHRNGAGVRLPVGYVTADTELGYASTIHTALGITAHTCHGIFTGAETREQLYTALTRGAAANYAHLAIAGTGDPHDITKPHTVHPPTPGELIAGILARDNTQRSATSHRRDLTNPAPGLHAAVEQYLDALGLAAETLLGPDHLAELDATAAHLHPGLTHAPAYPTLRAHLAVHAAAGHNPAETLRRAADERELDTALDPAAVLTHRLHAPTPQADAVGPLPWLPGIPAQLASHPEWGLYLSARAAAITDLATQVRDAAGRYTPATAPAWATPLLGAAHNELRGDVAVWRASTGTPDIDRRPTGPAQQTGIAARYRHHLDETIQAVLGEHSESPDAIWMSVANRLDPRITSDPYWPELSSRLHGAHRAGTDLTDLLTAAAQQRPLPDEHPASALWWRIASHLETPQPEHGRTEEWRTLTSSIDATLIDDPDYPRLAAAISRAHQAGYDVAVELPRLAARKPLPGDRPAAALLHRLMNATPTAAAPSPESPVREAVGRAHPDAPYRLEAERNPTRGRSR